MTGAFTMTLAKDNLVDLFYRGRERAAELGGPVLTSLNQPYRGEIGPLELFGRRGGPDVRRVLWGRPGWDFWLVGHGRAAELVSRGDTPVDAVKEKHREMLASAVIEAPDVTGVGPVFLGGFRYDTRSPADAIWRGFPNALLMLPRFLFTWTKGGKWLTVNTFISPDTDIRARAEATMRELRELEDSPATGHDQPPVERVTQGSSDEWRRQVETALRNIEAGWLSKVVLSRRQELRAAGDFSADKALGHLTRAYPGCAIFAVDNGEAVFLGASPEGLAVVEDGRLNVACLASSAPRGRNPDEDGKFQEYLLESRKERREHAAVASMLADTLKGVCRELRWEEEPRIIKLKNIQHLFTPFIGSLQPGINILDVVRQLHPTPAVGGVPTDRARQLIREIEADRGWYAAPVGWLDHTGGGDFAVAIRSALLRGDRAFLYAGCGIVAGSDPDSEYRETELKFQPLLAALDRGQ